MSTSTEKAAALEKLNALEQELTVMSSRRRQARSAQTRQGVFFVRIRQLDDQHH